MLTSALAEASTYKSDPVSKGNSSRNGTFNTYRLYGCIGPFQGVVHPELVLAAIPVSVSKSLPGWFFIIERRIEVKVVIEPQFFSEWVNNTLDDVGEVFVVPKKDSFTFSRITRWREKRIGRICKNGITRDIHYGIRLSANQRVSGDFPRFIPLLDDVIRKVGHAVILPDVTDFERKVQSPVERVGDY